MYSDFKNILIIEPKTDVGRLVRDVVKECGATDAVITDCVKAAWQYLQTADRPPDWIITFPDPDSRFNLFHLLRLVVLDPEMAKTRVSLIMTEDDKELLPLAFDMGLLSYHKKPFTKIALKAEIDTLLKALPADPNMHYEVATEYLRTFMNEREDFDGRVKLEKSLAAKFPKVTQYFLSLAEAQILAGKNDDARKTLGAAKHLGSNLSLGVKQLSDLVDPIEGGEATVAESFGIKSALIVETDGAIVNQIQKIFETIGIKTLETSSNGKEALDWLLKNGEPSFALMEWKLPVISGPALVQRIRQANMIGLPIIVMSSQLKEKDRNLLKEIGVAAVVPKPFSNEEMISEIVNVFQVERFSSSALEMERKIRQMYASGQLDQAQAQYQEFKKLSGVPKGLNLLVEATVKYHSGAYAEARDLASDALKEKGEAVVILNLLSKIFLKLGDKDSALKCLNRAQEFSSDNLERLVMMAETYAEKGDAGKAKEVIGDAKKVDASNELVIQAEAEVAITIGESQNAKSIIGQMDSAQGLIANMNNRAVLMVTNGDAKGAIDLYQNALASIPDHMATEKEILLYNSSLAYARLNKPSEAEKNLKLLLTLTSNKVTTEKAQSLLKRVEQAIQSKQSVKLNMSQDKKPPDLPSLSAKPVALHLRAGQMCLHGIFDATERYTEAVNKLLRASPVFNRSKMQTIKRDKAS